MKYKMVVIGDPEDSILSEIMDAARLLDELPVRTISQPAELAPLLRKNFQGFFIIALPAEKLPEWSHSLQSVLKDFFTVYYYHSIYVCNLSQFISLGFDFVLAGVQRKNDLSPLLAYLTGNYWKKIPSSLLKLENGAITNNLRKIISAFETADIAGLTLDKISENSGISPKIIREELRNALKMNVSDFKKLVRNYYRRSFPEEFASQ